MIFKDISELSQSERKSVIMRGRGLSQVRSVVEDILKNVYERGDAALLEYTEKFDKVKISSLVVSDAEADEALGSVDSDLMRHLSAAAENIRRFHEAQLPERFRYYEHTPGIVLGQMATPLFRVGCYVPGGRASYPSTVLMTVLPAKVAGVDEVIVCTPPMTNGRVHPLTIAAAKIAGADKIYKAGGAQAVGAMAYGTASIKPVDKIVGPGNVFVTEAKMAVQNTVDIDFPAGPSEVLIIADETASVSLAAADILAQAEHDPNSVSILVTPSKDFGKKVYEEIQIQKDKAERSDIINQSLENSAVLIGASMDSCIDFSNDFAPEHLQIMVNKDVEDEVLSKIKNAGSIFVGKYAPVPAGDYASGTNHVLPTSGYAKIYSGLNTNHFIKYATIQKINRDGLAAIKDTVIALSETEGLYAHADAVRKRFE